MVKGGSELKLTKLNISNFGLFHNEKIELSPGLNLIHGKNEAGKSTVHSFINGMLFDIEKTRGRPGPNDMYDKYQPWDRPGSYDGSLEFRVNDNNYHVYRNFNKSNKETVVTHVNTGRELDISQADLEEILGGLTKSGYEGTISIGQLSAKTEADLVYLVQNHITNLTMTRSQEIDVKKALEHLKEKAKQYDLKSLEQEINNLQDKIKEGEAAKSRLDDLSKNLSNIQSQEERLVQEKNYLLANKYFTQEELHRQLAKFPVIKTKYGYYLDSKGHRNELEERIESIKGQVDSLRKNKDNNPTRDLNLEELKSSMESINKYKDQYNKIAKEKYEYKGQSEDELALTKRRNLNIASPFFVLGIATSLLTNNDYLFKLGISLAVIGLIIFVALNLISNNKKSNFEKNYNSLDNEMLEIKKKIIAILQKYSVKSESELKNIYEEAFKTQVLLRQLSKELERLTNEASLLGIKIDTLKGELISYISQFSFIYPTDIGDKLELTDEIIGILDEYITDESLKLNKYEDIIKPKLLDLSVKKERIKWEIGLLEEYEEDLLDNKERLENLYKKKMDYESELASIYLATSTIQEIATGIHDTFGQRLNKLASKIAKEITNGKYKEIRIDEKLRIKTHINDQYQSLEKLSTGTIDQVYLALRLSIADLIYNKTKVPLLLDDTFAYYDDERLKNILIYLSKENGRQILLFTCHNREKEILDELGISYNYIAL